MEDSSGVRHITAKLLVNAAGLWATKVASLLAGMPAQHIPKQHYARGVYFTMAGNHTAAVEMRIAVFAKSQGVTFATSLACVGASFLLELMTACARTVSF